MNCDGDEKVDVCEVSGCPWLPTQVWVCWRRATAMQWSPAARTRCRTYRSDTVDRCVVWCSRWIVPSSCSSVCHSSHRCWTQETGSQRWADRKDFLLLYAYGFSYVLLYIGGWLKGKAMYTWYSASSWIITSEALRYGMCSQGISQFYLQTHTFIRNWNKPYLPLPSQLCSWYSFTDPGGMEGWVDLGYFA